MLFFCLATVILDHVGFKFALSYSMKRMLLPFAVMMISFLHSQSLKWVKTEPYPSYFGGYIKSINDFGGNVYTVSHWVNGGIYIVKYDSLGKKLWEKIMPGVANIRAVSVDNLGCLYVGLNISFLKIENLEYGKIGTKYLKFNSNGSIKWMKGENAGFRYLFDKHFSSDNLIMTTGSYAIPNKLGLLAPPNTSSAIYVGQIDTGLTMQWAVAKEGGFFYPPSSDAKNLFVSDYFPGAIVLGQGTNSFQPSGSYIAKYDSVGNRAYAMNFNGNGIAGENGHFYGFKFLTKTDGGVLIKLDGEGKEIWTSPVINAGGWYKTSMAVNDRGELFFGGGFSKFFQVGDLRIDAGDGTNAFFTKFDAKGKLLTLAISSGTGGAAIRDITIEGDNIWIAGEITGTVSFMDKTIASEGGVFTAMLKDDNNFVAIHEVKELNDGVILFPNPSIDQFTFSGNIATIEKVRVYTMVGKLILEQNDAGNVDLSNQAAGSYLVQLISSTGVTTKKVILSK